MCSMADMEASISYLLKKLYSFIFFPIIAVMHLEVRVIIASCNKPFDTKQNSLLNDSYFPLREQSIKMSFPDKNIK